MPENNYIGSASSRTNIGTSTTTVYVTVPKLRFFMEPRALSFAPAQSIPLSPPATSISKPSISPKDALDVLTQVVKVPNPMTILLMGLFYSPSVGDATMDRIFIGRPLEKRLIFGGFSRSASTVSTYDIRIYFKKTYPDMSEEDIDLRLGQIASIAIPKEVHRKCSETYGGRNNSWVDFDNGTSLRRKELDAKNLREAVERNWDVNRECLESEGYDSKLLDEKLDKIHELNEAKGLYK